MLPTVKNYAVWPGVVPADRETEMTIAPCEMAFSLFENEEYKVTVIPVDSDEPDYLDPTSHTVLTAAAHDGVLRFAFAFAGEQEYRIMLDRGETRLCEMTVYSLKEDLYALRPMKGDFHAHSYRSDGKRDPAALAGHYREQGYDFFALTDHNRFYPGEELDDAYRGVRMGIVRVPGEEVHAPGSVVHIVHVGGEKSAAEEYVKDYEGFKRDAAQYMAFVPQEVPEKYRERYAKAMWATDRIHEAGGAAIFPHPFWRPSKTYAHNIASEFARILLTSGMFDAYELVGGMKQPGNNRSVALWGDLRAEGLKIPVVGSSDVHGIVESKEFPHLFTICFAKDNTPESIVQALRMGNTVAVEATGDEYARHFRCYGSFRLVSYAQFLLQDFFPQQTRICQGEGVAMRAYVMGQADAGLIEMQAQLAENFRSAYFGKACAPVPTEAMLAFENRWRAVQLAGPPTKGSSIYPPTSNMQI